MKRFRKVLAGAAALVVLVVVGSLWLIKSALNVASDAVDSTLGSAEKVQAAAQTEIAGVAQRAQHRARAVLASEEPSVEAGDKPVAASAGSTPTAPTTNKVSDQHTHKDASAPLQSATKPKSVKEEGGFADFDGFLNLLLIDGEETSNPTALLALDSKEALGNKSSIKNTDDALTSLIPGANAPTVQRWMAGKYKGKEDQAMDDAIEDPKMWRLLFFLSGGM